jgi:YD repeat-containing protein
VFPQGSKWAFGVPSVYGKRCSSYEAPLDAVGQQGGDFSATEYWQGTFVYLPGKGDQELLSYPSSAMPTDGRAYPLTLADGSAVSCVANLAVGSNPSVGEGFEVVTRDGTRYRFDHMVTRAHSALKKSLPAPQAASARLATGVTPQAINGYILYRDEYIIYPTQVTDRFGNSVTYNWNSSNPNQLQSITSSDGRSISFTYVDSAGYQIQSASSAGRTWTYTYTSSISLSQVTLPDQSSWKFNLQSLVSRTPGQNGQCDNTNGGGTSTGSVTHPSGAVVTFGLQAVRMSRTWVPRECFYVDGAPTSAYYPKESFVMALVSKSINGPGLPSAGYNWTYSYDGTAGCWDPATVQANASGAPKCTSSTPSVRTATVTNPDGSVDKHVYGNRWQVDEGQLLSTQTAISGTAALRTETVAYGAPDEGPYPTSIGFSIQPRGDGGYASRHHPVKQRVIQQDGVTFSWSTTFDAMARPSQVTRSGPSAAVTEKTIYSDLPSIWVMDQPASVTNLGNGLVVAAGEYNNLGQLTKTYAFGRLTGIYGYGTGGMLSTVTDPNNRTTTYSNWKRGIPQSVGYADGNGRSAVVSDDGWITSHTDEVGYQYIFTYDGAGRLASTSYPSDGAPANPTTQVFEPIGMAEFGLAAGHWRQTVSTGNARKVAYYDSLWRPIVTREYDNGNETATKRFRRFAYDHEGRTTFASYPGTTDSLATGSWTSYDALGRETSVGQDTELTPSVQVATTAYLSGFKTRTTDPRGGVKITSFKAYDQPSYDLPIKIEAAEGTITEINRDDFGKPTAITRRDVSNTVSVTRSYIYNGYQQLCRSVEPESGATLVGYDLAGNVAWTAAGLAATQACDDGSGTAVSARKVGRTYDARNRLSTLSFPDGRGNQTWTYTPDGKPYQVTTANAGSGAESVINTYTYNARRQLIGEGMAQAGQAAALSIGYGYDANGNLATQTYPSGLTLSYAPNALGQPTQAGSYATGVSYYPNGAIKQFTYGNGVVHTMAQNARQMPARSTDTGGGAVIDMAYGFDPNGNVSAVTDYVDGRQTRSMTYDGLDRLATTQSVMFGGDNQAAFTYDALDNLKTFKVGAVSNYVYAYNARQQLETVSNAGSGSAVIGLGYDAQGNLANKNGQTYAFDYGNRLRSVPNKESYRYDASGRRVLSVASNGNIYSLYGQDGVLRYQQNQRANRRYEYIYLGGSLVARITNVQSVGTATTSVPASNGTGVYTVSWTAVTDAITYTLQEKVGSTGAWTTVYSGSATSYGASGKGTSVYSYRVQACAGSTCGGWSNEATVAVTLPSAPSAAPAVSAPANSSNGAYSISWTSVNTATSYEVKENGNGLYSGGGLSTSVSGRGTGNYTYTARACNSAGCGPWSAGATVAVTIPTPPSGAPAVSAPGSSSTGSYTVSWSAVGNASSYELQENGSTVYSGGNLSAGISGRGTGNYTYTARACNNVGCGPWSAGAPVAVTIPTPPSGAPTVSAPGSSSTGSYTVSWSAVGNASSYELQENSNTVYSGGNLALAIGGRGNGTYAYTARACNNVGCGPWSASASTTVALIPPTPVNTQQDLTNTGGKRWQYTAWWDAAPNATSYELQGYITYSGPNTSASTVKVGVNPPSNNPTYRVRACNATGCSAWSAVF